MVTHAMGTGGTEDTLRRRFSAIAARIETIAQRDRNADRRRWARRSTLRDEQEDERHPLLVGTLAWQRRERHRAEREGHDYTVEGAIKHEYLGLEARKRRLTQLTGREQDSMGLQLRPDVVSIGDLEAALTFVPNGRDHNKARWVYALAIGREPVIELRDGKRVETYKETAPRSISEASHWLNIPQRDAAAGYAEAEATLVAFLCHEGLVE